MAATPTTIEALDAAFQTAIEAIAPRTQRQRTAGNWVFAEGERQPGTRLRVFRLDWDDEGYTKGGFMGAAAHDTTMTLSVLVDYGGLAAKQAKFLAHDDHYQLRDVLTELKPTVAGLLYLEESDWGFTTASTADQAQVAHQFRVRFMKARAT